MDDRPGIVLLAGDEIGYFEIWPEEKISITFYKGSPSVREMLEFATEQGLDLSLMLRPSALGVH